MKNYNSLRVEECKNDKIWDNFIRQSHNKNFYSLSDVLNLEQSSKKYFLFKKNELIASFALNEKKKNIVDPIFNIYTPINYKKFENSKDSSINSYYFMVNSCVYEFITKNFKKINITFDYATKDLRPFLWHGYPTYKKKFQLNVKYTLESNIKNLSEQNYLNSYIYLNSSETNRREIRNALKQKYKFTELFSKDIFIELKKSSYKIHKKKIDSKFYKHLLGAYEKLNKNNLIKMFVSYIDQIPVFMTMFGIVETKAVFLHSGRINNIENKKNLVSVSNFFNSIINLSKNGIEKIDFEGINSPNNSVAKIKYGGFIRPYYSLELK